MRIAVRIQKIAPGRTAADVRCEATSDNDILFSFHAPRDAIHLGDQIEFDPEAHGVSQVASNLDAPTTFPVVLKKHDIHDVRLPPGHRTSRFPAPGRFNAA